MHPHDTPRHSPTQPTTGRPAAIARPLRALAPSVVSAVLVLAAWGTLAPAAAHADLRVVATTPDLAAVARELGGDRVSVTALALHTQDPHFVDPRPHLVLQLARADLLLVVGLGLEVGWLPTLQTGSRNGRVQTGGRGYLDCSGFARLRDVPRGRVDRSMGDVHPGGNPHYMLDPRQAVRVARGIAGRMAALDPDGARAYRQGLDAFVRRLEAARARWEERLGTLRGARVIAYHRSLAYLSDWLGLRVVAHLEPRPGIPPSPAHVARVIAASRREGVRLLLQETYYPTSTSELVTARIPAELVRIPVGPDLRAGRTYTDALGEVVRRIARAAAPR